MRHILCQGLLILFVRCDARAQDVAGDGCKSVLQLLRKSCQGEETLICWLIWTWCECARSMYYQFIQSSHLRAQALLSLPSSSSDYELNPCKTGMEETRDDSCCLQSLHQ